MKGYCPLNNIFICHIYTEEHPTDNCPSLLGLQAVYKSGDVAETSRRPPWKPRDQLAYQNFPPQPPLYYPPYQPPQQWNNSSWKNWPPQYPPPQFPQKKYWSQGWRGQAYPQSQPILVPNHPYPQHQTNFQQISPGFVPPVPFITQQPHHFQNTNPPP